MIVGTPLSNIEGLEVIKGKAVDVNDKKHIYVIECWATWCPPCRNSIPHLTDLQRKYATKGVVIIGVTNEPKAPVEAFVNNMGAAMDYTVALDTEDSVQELQFTAGVKGIPHSFVINMEGVIVFSGHPMDPSFGQALEEAVKQWIPPKITLTEDELMAMSVKELKTLLLQRGISSAGCLYKEDVVGMILEKCV